jgi:hypothetical protein
MPTAGITCGQRGAARRESGVSGSFSPLSNQILRVTGFVVQIPYRTLEGIFKRLHDESLLDPIGAAA